MNRFNIDERLRLTYGKYPEAVAAPVIGITANAGGEDFSIRQKYCEMVERAGGVPMLLCPTADNGVICRQLDQVDAVIFSGGGDHNPLWMGEQPSSRLHAINPLRDTHELLLCRLAYNRNIPMLGICRGMQTLAIALGGHVAQDISYVNASIKHSQDAPKDEPTHIVNVIQGTVLDSIYDSYMQNGNRSLVVNSFHHQAVDEVGPRMRVSAKAPDGVIEAMESIEHHSVIGVQWHPEQMGDDAMPLFAWLTKEAALFASAKALHASILTIDSHCDTPMFFNTKSIATDDGLPEVDFLTRDSRVLYDLHKMHDGRMDAVTMVCYLPQPKIGEKFSDNISPSVMADGTAMSPARYTDFIFDQIESICHRSDNVMIARTPADLYRDKREGRHSIMIGIENGLALEHDLHMLQHFKQRGIVYVTLCHNGDNDICDSARGCNTHGGVSSFGKKVIAEMNRLGIMVDLSHAAESSFYQALQLSSTPIVCSHSNCRALCDHPRNLTDDQMRALAQAGGVMQLTLYPGFISTTPTDYFTQFFRHLDHAIDVMGIDHVGIGTDFDGDGGVSGLSNAAELLNITTHLLRRRFSKQDIEKLWGGNWLRVMSIVLSS